MTKIINPNIDLLRQKFIKIVSMLQLKQFDNKIVRIKSPNLISTDGLHQSKSILEKHCFAFIYDDSETSTISYTLIYVQLNSTAFPEYEILQGDKKIRVRGVKLDEYKLHDYALQMRIASQDELKEIKKLIDEREIFLNVQDLSSYFKRAIKGSTKLTVYPKESFEPYDLFQLISKNKGIRVFFERCEEGEYSEERDQLEKVIKSAQPDDFENPIWKNKDCAVMILFLLKQGKISFEEAVAANMYLTFIDQLPESYRTKLNYQRSNIKDIARLVEQGKLTKLGLSYVKCIVQSFKEKMNVTIDPEDLKKYLLALTPIEQCVARSACKDYAMRSLEDEDHKTDSIKEEARTVDRFLWSILTNLPFVGGQKEEGTQYYCVPLSFQLINYFLKEINPEPVLLLPIPGAVNPSTLELLHKNRIHPYPYFLPNHIRTDLINEHNNFLIDGDDADLWVALLHDWVHAVASNLLTQEDRTFCLEKLIPAMQILFDDYPTAELLKLCVKFCDAIVDFNLTGKGEFKLDGGDNLRRFMKSKMKIGYCESSLENKKIGDTNSDLLYLILCVSTPHLQYEPAYQLILECCFNTDRRDSEVVSALQALARHHQDAKGQLISKDNCLKLCDVNWKSWQTLFNSILEKVQDEQQYNQFFWDAIKSNETLHRELLTLIQNGLILCPNKNICEQFPEFGLTKEKINEFRSFVKQSNLIKENNEHSAQFFSNGVQASLDSSFSRRITGVL
jgi:hypothetical protein